MNYVRSFKDKGVFYSRSVSSLFGNLILSLKSLIIEVAGTAARSDMVGTAVWGFPPESSPVK